MGMVVGIDLGTTNSVVACASLSEEQPRVELLPIPQLFAPGVVESRTALPSFLYLAPEHEAKGGAFDLPWCKGNNFVVGAQQGRSPSVDPALASAGRGAQGLAGDGFAAVLGASDRGVGARSSRGTGGRADGRVDGAGVVRCGGP